MTFLKSIHPSLYTRCKYTIEEKCDAVVYIGGSIFIEYKEWKQYLTWWDYEAKNRKFFILGANFGPYKTKEYRDDLADILNNVTDVCFRDKYSSELFSDVDKVRYAPDILFNYQFPDDVKSKKQIFISVIDCAGRITGMDKLSHKDEQYIVFIKSVIEKYSSFGYNIVLSSFCKIEKDGKTIDKIVKQLNVDIRNQVKIINYDGTNVNEITSAIAESELVIASRFHASILGFAAGKPVLPVVYSDKTINILKDLNFDGCFYDIRTLTNIDVCNILKLDLTKQKLQNLNEIKKKSKEHFLKLDNLLLN